MLYVKEDENNCSFTAILHTAKNLIVLLGPFASLGVTWDNLRLAENGM